MIVDDLIFSKWFNVLSTIYINNIRLNKYNISIHKPRKKRMIANHLEPQKNKF